jgi:hypothetical protein
MIYIYIYIYITLLEVKLQKQLQKHYYECSTHYNLNIHTVPSIGCHIQENSRYEEIF